MVESKLWYNQTITKMVGFIKTCDQYPNKFNFNHFFNSSLKLYQKIWIWNLDKYLILVLLITAACNVLL